MRSPQTLYVVFTFYFSTFVFLFSTLLTLTFAQMASPTPFEGGDTPYHTDNLAQEGFPLISWEVLQEAGYHARQQYMVQLFEEHGVPRCKVWLALEPHPLQLGWCSLDSETLGFRAHNTTEVALTTFCGFHPLEMATHPISLFPAAKEDGPMWSDRVEHAKEVWALFPGATAQLTVQSMSALYRLQARGHVTFDGLGSGCKGHHHRLGGFGGGSIYWVGGEGSLGWADGYPNPWARRASGRKEPHHWGFGKPALKYPVTARGGKRAPRHA
jgi:hypothetical protein